MLITALILTAVEGLFVLLARRLGIGAPPSHRSSPSHRRFTPTAGGIVFLVALYIFALTDATGLSGRFWLMFAGANILCIVSFADDLKPLPPVPRLIVQILVMALAFNHLCYPEAFYMFLLVLLCGVGFINALNFLDGITGMLALYGFVVMMTLVYAFHCTDVAGAGLFMRMGTLQLIALAVFAAFNLAGRVFAGDTGSITLGFIITYMLATLMLETRDASYLVFIMVCICDTGLTTLQRLFAGENILLPHRQNIYQTLVNRFGMAETAVALIYALLQLLINSLFFQIPHSQRWTFFIVIGIALVTLYFIIRQAARRHR